MAIRRDKIVKYGIIGLLVVVIGIAGFYIYALQKEKSDFAQAEKDIDDLALQIEQLVGKPDETKKEKSCDRANRAYSNGPIGCGIVLNMIFNNNGIEESNKILSTISKTFNSELFTPSGLSNRGLFEEYSGRGPGDLLTQNIKSPSKNITCTIAYNFPVSQESKKGMKITISCGGNTMKNLYS